MSQGLVLTIATIVSVLFFLGLTALSVFRYPSNKTKNKGSYRIDINFLLGYLSLNVINICIISIFKLADSSANFNAVRFFDAIASTIATFSFNSIQSGMDLVKTDNVYELRDILKYVSIIMYYIMPLNLGIMLFTVASYNFAYEFNSSIRIARLFNFKKNKIYVFSSLTDDSLTLAKDIKEKEKKAIIFFYGESLPQFDKKDPLCKEILINGFYYRSVVKDKPIGVLKSKNKNLYYFAMDLNDKLLPAEEKNAHNIFESMKKYIQPKNSEYYVLVSDKSDLAAYQAKYDKIISEIKGNNTSIYCDNKPELYCICEANIASKDLVEKISSIYKRNYIINDDKGNQKDIYDKLNLFIVGFGELGQSVLDKFYSNFVVSKLSFSEDINKRYIFKCSYSEVRAKVFDLKQKQNYLKCEYENKNPYYYVYLKDDSKNNTNEYVSDYSTIDHTTDYYLNDYYNISMNELAGDKINKYSLSSFYDFINLRKQIIDNLIKNSITTEYKKATMILSIDDLNTLLKQVSEKEKNTKEEAKFDSLSNLKKLIKKCLDYDIFLNCNENKNHFTKVLKKIMSSSETVENAKANLSKEMIKIYNPPIVEINNNENIFKQMDEYTGVVINNKEKPNFFVLCTGDDLVNIDYVNYLISDIRYEYFSKKNYGDVKLVTQIIAVNIRNEKNIYKIDMNYGTELEFKEISNNVFYSSVLKLYIIIFGLVDDIYSYKLLNREKEKHYNYSYSIIYNFVGAIQNNRKDKYNLLVKEINDIIENNNYKSENTDISELFNKIYNVFDSIDKVYSNDNRNSINKYNEAIKYFSDISWTGKEISDNEKMLQLINSEWKTIELSAMESNNMVYLFRKQYKWIKEIFKDKVLSQADKFVLYVELMQLEHIRWMRYHISIGYTLGSRDKKKITENGKEIKYDNKKIKYHHDIRPLLDINPSDKLYDLVNVIDGMNSND